MSEFKFQDYLTTLSIVELEHLKEQIEKNASSGGGNIDSHIKGYLQFHPVLQALEDRLLIERWHSNTSHYL